MITDRLKTKEIMLIILAVIVPLGVLLLLVLLVKRNKVEKGELEGEDILTTDPGIIGIPGIQTWDSKSDEVIKKLHPKIRGIASNFINELDALGIKYRIYSGSRTFDEQAALYGKGRTPQQLEAVGVDKKYSQIMKDKVTNAKPGSSYHNYGLAFDGVEIKDNIALWNMPNEKIIVDTAKKYGLFWGGDFTSLKDTPHFEQQQYGTVNQLLALYNAGNTDSLGYLIV